MFKNIENLSVISGLQPDRLIKHYVSDDVCRAEVMLPGLWYTDFDRKFGGKWMLSSILETFNAIRFAVLTEGFINFSFLCDRNHTFFVAGAVYNFSLAVHEIIFKTHWCFLFPIRARISLSHVGMSSFSIDIVMYNDSTGEQLTSCVSKLVYVDLITRKPSPIPSWFLEYQKNVYKILNITVEKPKLLNIPENCFTFRLRVYFSDKDTIEHVSQSTYVRWCSDVGSFAAKSGYYRNFREDIGVYPLERLETHYLGEMQAEDIAEVHTWQDITDFRELYFCVTKCSNVVFQAHFHFTNDIPSGSRFVQSKI
ncbi:hypothetical protein CHS0354_031291 [Potamilus streckersoni]|uniref:Uncharacterized protein n=1 Tax=Potamilus streckersoni TaxID=2493646 RepID=A0AAE0TCF2_9BIVA|nr:hypothetical protein CHS0354_031291 [Potamilus streckersoni]